MFYKGSEKLKKYDLLVLGNSLAAVISAAKSRKAGESVALITESELLLSDFSESMIGILQKESTVFPELGKIGIIPEKREENFIIPQGAASKSALEYLLKAGVHIYLKASPIGILKNKDDVCGIAIATKFGAYTIFASSIADFCDREYLNKPTKALREYIFSFQMSAVDECFENCEIPTIKNAYDIKITKDIYDSSTYSILFKSKLESGRNCFGELYLLAVDICQYLIENEPAFKNAYMFKYALRPISTEMKEETIARNFIRFHLGDIRYSESLRSVIEKASSLPFVDALPESLETSYGSFPLAPLFTGRELDDFLGAELKEIKIPLDNIPTESCDLFIAGLGAGGISALKGALKSKIKIAVAEAMPTPGGTRTHGMVSAFWHGYQGGFADANKKAFMKSSDSRIGKKAPMRIKEALYDFESAKGCNIFYSTFLFGAIKTNGNTSGALLASEEGIVKIEAKKFIDATGDADLATLSGAEYMRNGDDRDFVPQCYSIWGLDKSGTEFQNSLHKGDDDSLSTERYSEYLRGIFETQLKNSDYGFSPLMTVRESRRLKGRYVISMEDILKRRCFEDTIGVSLCLYDAHGMGTSPAYYTSIFGGIKGKGTKEVLSKIPLRALLPKEDDGLMVISKAISATRDAGCLIRMNPDIQNVGYAAGMVAGNAAKQDIDFQSAYSKEIREILEKEEVLPDFYNKAPDFSAESFIEKILENDKRAMAEASAHKEFLPEFLADFEGQTPLAMVLVAMGCHDGFDCLLEFMKESLALYKKGEASALGLSSAAVLLSRLAAENASEREKLLPILREAIEVIDAGGEYIRPELGLYQLSKVTNRTIPNFRMILALAIAAETIPDPSLVSPLLKLSKKQNIRLEDGDEMHSVQLYLRLISAAARCTSEEAKQELKKYLDSEKLFFREFAKAELSALTTDNPTPVPVAPFWI